MSFLFDIILKYSVFGYDHLFISFIWLTLLLYLFFCFCFVFFFKHKTAYEMRISDWSSDVCSSDLLFPFALSLSKGRSFLPRLSKEVRCFDKLSTNGF